MGSKKKIAFITALSMCVTLLAGCEPIGENGTEIDEAVTTTEAVTEENDAAEETEAVTAETTEVTETSEVTAAATEKTANKEATGYEEALRAFYEAENNSDYEDFLNYMYPAKIVDYMKTISGISAEAMAEGLGTSDAHYEVTDMVTEGEISAEDLDTLTLNFDAIYSMYRQLETEGKTIDDLTDQEKMEFSSIFYGGVSNADIPKIFKVTEGYDVTVHYLVDGKPDEDYFFVYYIEGDDWKLNNSMRKYAKNAMQNSLNSNAKSLYTAAQTVLVEAEADGTSVFGTYIISSDPSKNINVPSGINTDDFCDMVTANSYLYEEDKYDYFVLVKDGECLYSAIHKNVDGYGVGVFPLLSIPEAINGKTLETKSVDRLDGYTIDDLYDICVKLVK